jgi:hypothetical protein
MAAPFGDYEVVNIWEEDKLSLWEKLGDEASHLTARVTFEDMVDHARRRITRKFRQVYDERGPETKCEEMW